MLFTGPKFGEELARHYADADVFVFPSLTDTFGLVILEAMAAGTPVAGYDAPGPRDIMPGTGAGVVERRSAASGARCAEVQREAARALAEKYSWRACAEEFRRNLEPLPKPEKKRFWKRLAEARHRARERRRAQARRQGSAAQTRRRRLAAPPARDEVVREAAAMLSVSTPTVMISAPVQARLLRSAEGHLA